MIDLKQFAGVKYRINLDESAELDPARENRVWYWRIPCKYGFIGVHGPETLSAFTSSTRIGLKLMDLPGVKVHQQGDREVRVLFTPDCLDAVATLLQAKRRRQVSPAERERLVAMGAANSPFRHR